MKWSGTKTEMNHTPHFIKYRDNIEKLRAIPKDDYIIKLLYANVITLMELYLADALVFTVQDKENLLKKVASSRYFKNPKYKVSLETVFTNNMERHLIAKIKEINFQILADVSLLYQDSLDIRFEQKSNIKNAIRKCHHIIHRNGKDYNGDPVEILNSDLDNLIRAMDSFLADIDNQLYQKFGSG